MRVVSGHHALDMNTSFLLVHSSINLNHVWNWMQFRGRPPWMGIATTVHSKATVAALLRPLQLSSCAVVGASSALTNCTYRHDICSHDVVIHANDHMQLLRYCPRVDIQFVNAHACYWKAGAYSTKPQGMATRPCGVHPTRARIRHEWNHKELERYATGAFLSSGWANDVAHKAVGKCCASAGGVAAAFAIRACKSVTVYGLAGINRSHVDSTEIGTHSVYHNMRGEVDWLLRLEREGVIVRRC